MQSDELYLANRDVIERSIKAVCRRHYVRQDDVEEFASNVRLHLIENDYAVLRKFQGRSSLRTYLMVVVARQFQDWRNAKLGKWRPSAEARRLGEVAVLLERFTVRDGLTLDQAHELLQTNHAVTESREVLERMAARFPSRAGRRLVPIENAEQVSSDVQPDVHLRAQQARLTAVSSADALSSALGTLPPEDRLILRLRFQDDCTVAQVARLLHVDQKALYRRLDRLLVTLRTILEHSGLTSAYVSEALSDGGFEWAEASGWSGRETPIEVRLWKKPGGFPTQTGDAE